MAADQRWSGPGQDMVLSVVRLRKFAANLVILAEHPRTAAALGELFRPSDHRLIFFISFDISPCHWHTLTHSGIAPAQAIRTGAAAGRGEMDMAGELHTVAEAAAILKVRESWLKRRLRPG
jgi:hypothetical protein